jgi:hypothetical protein
MRDSHCSRRRWNCALFWLIPLLSTAAAIAAQPSPPSIRFLTKNDGAKAIVDESKDPYFSRLQPMEMAAKTGSPVPGDTLDQQREECRRRYAQAVEEFTQSEKDTLQWYVSNMVAAAAPYPLFDRTPWSFIKVSGPIEGGQPFTRADHIILPSVAISEMMGERQRAPSQAVASDFQWMALERFGNLLVHEQTHVVQRLHPEVFARLYVDFWGFKHAAKIETDSWLSEHQLLDPDGADQNWVFPIKEGDKTRWIWPLIVLEDGQAPTGPSFADARQLAIELEPTGDDTFRVKTAANGRLVSRSLMLEMRYASHFSPSRNLYHPNEISADLFARVIVVEHLSGHPPDEAKDALEKGKQRFKPLQELFAKILGTEHS